MELIEFWFIFHYFLDISFSYCYISTYENEQTFIIHEIIMRKKDPEKEQAILKAAIHAFAEQGFHATKMSMIADNAGVAAGSLYLYFKNKESIVKQIIDAIWTEMYNKYLPVQQRPDLTAIEKLDSLIDLVFDIFSGSPEKAIIFVNEQHHLAQKGFQEFKLQEEKFINLCESIIKEGAKEGFFNAHINIGILKDFVFGGLRHLLDLWAHHPDNYALNQIRQEIKHIIKKGILT